MKNKTTPASEKYEINPGASDATKQAFRDLSRKRLLRIVDGINGVIASRNLYRQGEKQNERVIHAHLNKEGEICVTGLYSEKSIPIAGETFTDGYGKLVTFPTMTRPLPTDCSDAGFISDL